MNENGDKRRRSGAKGFGDKQFADKKFGDKQFAGRDRGGKPGRFGGKGFGGGKFGDRKFGDRKFGDRKFGGRRDRPRDDFVHQRDLVRVAGRSAVAALFARAPERVERLFFVGAAKESAVGYCRVLAKSRKVFREVAAEEIARIAGTPMHGGIVAVAKPQPVRAFDPAEAARLARSSPLLPILHGVSNPHNLGAVARSAAFLGMTRIVLSDHPAQAGLSDAALRTAEGGFEALDVYRATNLADALRRLKAGYRVLGATLGRGLAPDRVPRDRPIALVLGNEETGLDSATLAACDEAVTIPGTGGAVQSLNVSVAAGILFYLLGPPAGST